MQTRKQWKGGKDWKVVSAVAGVSALGLSGIALAGPGDPQSTADEIQLRERTAVTDVTVTTLGTVTPSTGPDPLGGAVDSGLSASADSSPLDSPSPDSPSPDSPSPDSPSPVSPPSPDSPSPPSPDSPSPVSPPSPDSPDSWSADSSMDSGSADSWRTPRAVASLAGRIGTRDSAPLGAASPPLLQATWFRALSSGGDE